VTLVLVLAAAIGALAAVAGITLGLGDAIATRSEPARRVWCRVAGGLTCLALGLNIAALVLIR
jgi:hypothetical protein